MSAGAAHSAARARIATAGAWLFRRRSFLPLLLLPVLFLSMLAGEPSPPRAVWAAAGPVLLALGLAVRVAVIGHAPARTSMRNVHRFQADTLSTAGMYAVVRHPLYLGNVLVTAGLFAVLREPIGLVTGIAVVGLLYAAIAHAEDGFLAARFGEAHARWRAHTHMLLPAPSRWRAPVHPFSLRTVLRKEHPTWLAVPLLGLALDAFTTWRLGNPALSPGWMGASIAGLVTFAILRALKYRTRRLHVPGR